MADPKLNYSVSIADLYSSDPDPDPEERRKTAAVLLTLLSERGAVLGTKRRVPPEVEMMACIWACQDMPEPPPLRPKDGEVEAWLLAAYRRRTDILKQTVEYVG